MSRSIKIRKPTEDERQLFELRDAKLVVIFYDDNTTPAALIDYSVVHSLNSTINTWINDGLILI